MGRQPTRVSIVHQRALNQVMLYVARAPVQASFEPRVFVRAVRSALRMSQAQLARRSGVDQAHIARLEKGFARLELTTLRRLFDAMFCDLLVLPRPRRRPNDALADLRLESRGDLPCGRSAWRPDWDDGALGLRGRTWNKEM